MSITRKKRNIANVITIRFKKEDMLTEKIDDVSNEYIYNFANTCIDIKLAYRIGLISFKCIMLYEQWVFIVSKFRSEHNPMKKHLKY